MRIAVASLTLLSLFTSSVAAIDFVGSGKEIAAITIAALWIPITLVQLIFAITYLFMARPGHRIVGPVASVALLFLFSSYVLFVTLQVIDNTTAFLEITINTWWGIVLSQDLLSYWADALIILAVALIIRDRHITKNTQNGDESSALGRLPTWPIVGFFAFLTFLIVILAGAQAGLLRNTNTIAKVQTERGLDRSLTALYFIATFFLLPFAIVTKIHVKSDKITNALVFVITPFLLLRAIAAVILLSFNLRLVELNLDPDLMEIMDVLFEEIFYLVALSVLCYFFVNPQLWDIQGGKEGQNHYQYAYPQGGFRPPEQFPGQWGFTNQPQMPIAPAMQAYWQPQMYGQPQVYGTLQQQQPIPPQTQPPEAVPPSATSLSTIPA